MESSVTSTCKIEAMRCFAYVMEKQRSHKDYELLLAAAMLCISRTL
jgi:hypothetical protein